MYPLRLLKWMGNKLLNDKLVLNGQKDAVCIPHFHAHHPIPLLLLLLLLLLLPWQFHRALSSSLVSQTSHSTTLSTLQNESERRSLILISLRCVNLMWLKLRGCHEIMEVGMAAVGENYKALKKLSCASCVFGIKGINAIVSRCQGLEELSVKRLRGAHDVEEVVGSGTTSVTSVYLKEIDDTLEKIGNLHAALVDVHLEKIQVSDVGLVGLCKCLSLDTLHIVKIAECSNVGLNLVAENRRMLRKLHELTLIGIYPTSSSLEAIASKCKDLERLALCGLNTVGDAEI
ncbi:F-box/LRR-repeat protein 16-like [Arachis hypogaea]|uniref:F-box/LRR-repeat protein 16-like n=1 Tax=Arachis hypogaea TaxID=3818 RepID=UPI0010FC5A1C|nr:F-box/LRR-repeat protein 16-like [Arachis hypogaea]